MDEEAWTPEAAIAAMGATPKEVTALRQRYPRVGCCILCGPMAYASGHKSRQGKHHLGEHLSDEEFIEYDSTHTSPMAPNQDYLIEFGQYSGKYLSTVLSPP